MASSSSIYIHVPFCRHLCNYCDFFKYREGSENAPTLDEYERSLLKSWKHLQKIENILEISPSSQMKTIYLGGGTPSLWGRRGADFLARFFLENKLKTDEAQWTLEVDPGTCTLDELKHWNSIGVNRFSLGLQTLDPDYLKLADRKHTIHEARDMLTMLSSEGVSYSADFLLGLPLSSGKRNIEKELEEILSYDPDHLSLYILTTSKNYQHYSSLPSDDFIEAEYLRVSEVLTSRGYDHYEVSNFSKPGKRSEHNFVYWAGASYWGLGPSATGQWRQSAEAMERYKWSSHYKFQVESLGRDELQLEELYLSLRTNIGFTSHSVPAHLCERWQASGLVKFSNGRYRCTAKGYLVVDSLISEIFSYTK